MISAHELCQAMREGRARLEREAAEERNRLRERIAREDRSITDLIGRDPVAGFTADRGARATAPDHRRVGGRVTARCGGHLESAAAPHPVVPDRQDRLTGGQCGHGSPRVATSWPARACRWATTAAIPRRGATGIAWRASGRPGPRHSRFGRSPTACIRACGPRCASGAGERLPHRARSTPPIGWRDSAGRKTNSGGCNGRCGWNGSRWWNSHYRGDARNEITPRRATLDGRRRPRPYETDRRGHGRCACVLPCHIAHTFGDTYWYARCTRLHDCRPKRRTVAEAKRQLAAALNR